MTAIAQASPDAVDIAEAAKRLAISRRTIASLIQSGELRSFKIGRARRISVAALAEFVRRRETESLAIEA